MKAQAAESPRHPSAAPRCDAGIVFAVPIEADAFGRLAADRVEIRAAAGDDRGRRRRGPPRGVVRLRSRCRGGHGSHPPARRRAPADGRDQRRIRGGPRCGSPARIGRPPAALDRGGRPAADPALDSGRCRRGDRAPRPSSPWIAWWRRPRPSGASPRRRERTSSTWRRTPWRPSPARRACPARAVRVISDDATEDLPREIAALAAPQSALRRLGAAFNAVGHRPRPRSTCGDSGNMPSSTAARSPRRSPNSCSRCRNRPSSPWIQSRIAGPSLHLPEHIAPRADRKSGRGCPCPESWRMPPTQPGWRSGRRHPSERRPRRP